MKPPKLSRGEFAPYALKSTGDVRVNHKSPECSGDSRSLLITTKVDGSVSAKCFRCGGVGWIPPEGYVDARAVRSTAKKVSMSTAIIPHDAVDFAMWPMPAKAWWFKAKLSERDAVEKGVKYSEKQGAIIMPVLAENSTEVVGAVHRGVMPDAPRYRMLTKDGDECVFVANGATLPDRKQVVIVVEDIPSAIRVGNAGYNAVALLGVAIRKRLRRILSSGTPRKVVVWLDNDTSNVINSATELSREFPWLQSYVVRDYKDAKHYSETQIINVLTEILK